MNRMRLLSVNLPYLREVILDDPIWLYRFGGVVQLNSGLQILEGGYR